MFLFSSCQHWIKNYSDLGPVTPVTLLYNGIILAINYMVKNNNNRNISNKIKNNKNL